MTLTAIDSDIRWIFRAGTKGGFGEIERLNYEIAFSFRDMADLSQLPNSRGAFRGLSKRKGRKRPFSRTTRSNTSGNHLTAESILLLARLQVPTHPGGFCFPDAF